MGPLHSDLTSIQRPAYLVVHGINEQSIANIKGMDGKEEEDALVEVASSLLEDEGEGYHH